MRARASTTSTSFLLRLEPETAGVVHAWASVSGTPPSVVLRQCVEQMVPLLRILCARLAPGAGPIDAAGARADVEQVLLEVLSHADVPASRAGAEYIRASRTLIGEAADGAARAADGG